MEDNAADGYARCQSARLLCLTAAPAVLPHLPLGWLPDAALICRAWRGFDVQTVHSIRKLFAMFDDNFRQGRFC